jgi:hypothetical protein
MSSPTHDPVIDPVDEPDLSPCPRCGAGVDSEQEYCLECGLRLPQSEGLPARLGEAWKRRLSWYPGDWLWPVLAFLLIAVAGASAAIASTEHDRNAKQPAVLTSPVQSTASVPVPTAPEQTLPATTVTATAPSPKPKPRPRTPRGFAVWPAGRSGYTLVLSSIPKQPNGTAKADAEARKALAAGLTQVGVLDSDGFSSLHPGYYVVFSGIDGSYSQANARLARAHAVGYGVAYPRRVTH